MSYQHNGNYQVISSKYFYACNKVSFLELFFYFAKGGPYRSLLSLGDFSKKLKAKIGDFVLRNKGREGMLP